MLPTQQAIRPAIITKEATPLARGGPGTSLVQERRRPPTVGHVPTMRRERESTPAMIPNRRARVGWRLLRPVEVARVTSVWIPPRAPTTKIEASTRARRRSRVLGQTDPRFEG
jgi:hypothetical protein